MKIELPITVRIDNVGAMFMAETANASSRSRHIDVKYHHVREELANGFVKLVFVSSDKNLADSFTKNVARQIMEKHFEEMMVKKS